MVSETSRPPKPAGRGQVAQEARAARQAAALRANLTRRKDQARARAETTEPDTEDATQGEAIETHPRPSTGSG